MKYDEEAFRLAYFSELFHTGVGTEDTAAKDPREEMLGVGWKMVESQGERRIKV